MRKTILLITLFVTLMNLSGCNTCRAGRYKEETGSRFIELKEDGTFVASAGIPHLKGVTKGTYSCAAGIMFNWELGGKSDFSVASLYDRGFIFSEDPLLNFVRDKP